MATAKRLRMAGWEPVIVERASARRLGGYFVVLFEAGRAAAERLGMLKHLHDRKSLQPGVDLTRSGKHRPGLSYVDMPGQPWLMVRGDVEQAAFAELPTDIEVRYSTSPTEIVQDADGVDVTLLDARTGTSSTERFDLVVGADGIRSTVRSLVFGPHEKFIHPLGYMIAAFEFPGTPEGLEPGVGATFLEPDRGMWVYAFTDRDPTIMLSYRTDDVAAERSRPAVESVRAAFGANPPQTLVDVMNTLESSESGLFDSADQVRMSTWHQGRVVLLGDSAWCVTVYAGMGVSSALAGADLLGTMLEQNPDDLESVLAEWERGMRPYVAYYQKSGVEDRAFFVPDSKLQLLVRRLLPIAGRTRFGQRVIAKLLNAEDVIKYKNANILAEVLGGSPHQRKESQVAQHARHAAA